MISRYFIDRPVFGTVISVVVVLLGLVSYSRLPLAQYPEVAPTVVQVTATMPGASAKTVAETIAAPIEQEINGVENMLYMSSRSTNDGRMMLDVTFNTGTNLDMAQVLVQNRVASALSRLPEEARRQGVNTRKKSPSILLCVNLVSDTDPSTQEPLYDMLFLGNYATTRLNDMLARLPGVGSVEPLGSRDFSMRVWLDPDKMASRSLAVEDVLTAIREQNIQVAAGVLGQPPAPKSVAFELTINAQGRLKTEDEFEKIIVKTGTRGQNVYLADVVRDQEYRVRLDPERVKAAGTSAAHVRKALMDAGHFAPKGDSAEFNLKSARRSPWAIQIGLGGKEIPLRDLIQRSGGISTVSQGVELGAKSYSVNSYLDGAESVCLAVYQQPGSNAVATARGIRELMKEQAVFFPPGMRVDIVYDTTVFIEESIEVVYHTLLEAVVLVLIVVLLFLKDWRITILPMIEVPVSLIGTFGVMALLGFSLNNLSLFGLVLAIGIVVDDAIVVIENVERWIAKGYDPKEAARRAMDETAGAVVAIAIVLAAVFIPTAFLTGISGQFFRQFALTIAGSTLISAMNALTMTPSRCASIMQPHGQSHAVDPLPRWALPLIGVVLGWFQISAIVPQFVSPWVTKIACALLLGLVGRALVGPCNNLMKMVFAGFEELLGLATTGYGSIARGVVRRAGIFLVVYVVLLGITGYGFANVPVGFVPDQDKGYLIVAADLPQGASLGRTDAVVRKLDKLIRQDDAVSHVLALPGFSVLSNTNVSQGGALFVVLKPFEERQRHQHLSALVTRDRLKLLLAGELDAATYVFNAPPVDGVGSTGGLKFLVQDRSGAGLEKLEVAANTLQVEAASDSRLAAVFSTFSTGQPQVFLDIDRVKAKTAGVSLSQIFSALSTYLGGVYVNDISLYGRNWQVNVQGDSRFRLTPADIRLLQVRGISGAMVPLGTLVSIVEESGPAIVTRFNLYPSAEVNAIVAPGVSSGEGMAAVDALAKRALPNGFGHEWTEMALQQRLAASDPINVFIFPLGVVFVFLALAAQYESWSLPAAILLIVPMCLLSALAGVLIWGLDNNLFVQIGLVVLVGLAAKNAILIVEFAKQQEDEGKSAAEAVIEAARMRLRPILMTSAAFILGVLPLVLSVGAGAEMRRAIGVTVFCGMLGVTVFGLLFTPVFYVLIRRWFSSNPATVPSSPDEAKHQ